MKNVKTDLKQWIERYSECFDADLAQKGLDEFKAFCAGRTVIIYGAGKTGRYLSGAFQKLGISITCFIDKNFSILEAVGETPVYPPEWLANAPSKDDILLIAAASCYKVEESLREDFQRLESGITDFIDDYRICAVLVKLLCYQELFIEGQNYSGIRCTSCPEIYLECPAFNKYSKSYLGESNINNGGSKKFNHFAYMLGQICTLKCECCAEGIPYVDNEHRKRVSKDVVVNDIKKIASACHALSVVEFSGGEPFLHPQLNEILIETLAIKNVFCIRVVSNGTVIPNDELINTLSNPRITILISDYGNNLPEQVKEKIKATHKKLNDFDIKYTSISNKIWFDVRSFDKKNVSEDELDKVRSDCSMFYCYRLHEGTLYGCSQHFVGVKKGVYDEKTSGCIDINSLTVSELSTALDEFASRTHYYACRYCPLPYDAPLIPAGIQLKAVNHKEVQASNEN